MVEPQPQSSTTPTAPSRGLAIARRVFGQRWLKTGLTVLLEVRGRRTGTPYRVALVPVDVGGTSYLLSQYGVTGWVRNLRAAGRGELSRKGRVAPFKAVEVDGAERDRVIAAFRAKMPRPFRGDFEQRPAAADHPTFRVEPTIQP